MSLPGPRCVVLAGPNGAGKSSIAPLLVKELFGIGRYVNPDVIAAGLSGFDPSIVDVRAARIALQTIDHYISARVAFAFETTLSGRRWPCLLHYLERAGFNTCLYYLWLPSDDVAVARVRFRVARAGTRFLKPTCAGVMCPVCATFGLSGYHVSMTGGYWTRPDYRCCR